VFSTANHNVKRKHINEALTLILFLLMFMLIIITFLNVRVKFVVVVVFYLVNSVLRLIVHSTY